MLLQALILVGSIALLYFGAELALDGAEKVGRALKFSPLVIGLVIVGFGTSLPEFFVSHMASSRGEYSLALGNIVGSNVANLFWILGLAGLMTPLALSTVDIKQQLLWHLALTVMLCFGLVFADSLSIALMIILLGFFVTYLGWTYREMKKNPEDTDEQTPEKLTVMLFVKLNIGFVLLFLGGEYLVSSGSTLGEMLGISPFVISAIFVAFGTSFPEMVTAIMACVKKKDTNLIVGNILGSNIFNVALILGSLGIYRLPLNETVYYAEAIVLTFASLTMIFMAWRGMIFNKKSGALFLGIYGLMIMHWVSHY